MAETNKELTTANTGFAIVDQPAARETMMAAFEQLGITENLLQRIKVPTGGMSAFQVDELDGPQVYQHIDVILIAIKGRQKAWWASSLEDSGGGAPPTCTSKDGIHGVGNNTIDADAPSAKHLCSECPWNQFGSSRFGSAKGKDCKDYSLLFFFRNGNRIPSVMTVPATSLKGLQNYILRLIDNGKRFEGVVTRLSLDQTQNASGIAYSKLAFGFESELDPASANQMVEIGKDFLGRIEEYDTFEEPAPAEGGTN